MVFDAQQEVQEKALLGIRSKDELAKTWVRVRKEALDFTAEDIIGDIKARSKIKIQDLSQRNYVWKPEIFTDQDGRKGISFCGVNGSEFAVGLESFRAGFKNFLLPEKSPEDPEGEPVSYLTPYPEFDEDGEYKEEQSFLIRLDKRQFEEITKLIEDNPPTA